MLYSKFEMVDTLELDEDDNKMKLGVLVLPMFNLDPYTEFPYQSINFNTITYTIIASNWSYNK